MTVTISRTALAGILREVASSPDREVCGLLIGRGDLVADAVPCANVAADPARWFEIDPAALLAAHRRARGGGPAVLGHYHSHPTGTARPSPRDADAAAPDGALWLIVAGGEARLWRAVADGPVERRFEPVAMIVPDACTDAAPSPEERA